MQKYMTHPKHGGMLVYMDDFEQKQKEGWVFGEEVKPILQLHHPDAAPELSLEEQYEEKFGKRPHWKMKQETIKNALKE